MSKWSRGFTVGDLGFAAKLNAETLWPFAQLHYLQVFYLFIRLNIHKYI